MIPTVLLIGFVGGVLIPTRGLWIVLVSVIVWTAFLVVDGSMDGFTDLLGGTALGAVNAVVGFVVGAFVRSAFEQSRQR